METAATWVLWALVFYVVALTLEVLTRRRDR